MCEIGKKIKELRLSLGITQCQLGSKIGVSEKVISKWENGDTTPGIEHLPAIANAFNVDIDFLFDRKRINFEDINISLCEYMKSIPQNNAIREAHRLFSFSTIGMEMREMEDSGYYSQDSLNETQSQLISLTKSDDSRIQHHAPGISQKDDNDAFWAKDYLKDSVWSAIRGEARICVLQTTDDLYLDASMKSYDITRKVFDLLATHDIEKLISGFVFGTKPKSFTLEYLSESIGITAETAKKFIELLFILKNNTNEVIIEERKAIVSGAETTIYNYYPGVFEIIFKSVISTAFALTGERNGFR